MEKGKREFTSGVWAVKDGREDEFVARWSEFAVWTKKYVPGSISFMLLQGKSDSRRFISAGEWQNSEVIAQWRATSEFKQSMTDLRELCDDVQAGDFLLRTSSNY